MQRINIYRRLQKGFTLIELLVVIAVIGILLSIIAFSYTTAQKQGRDVRRRQDIQETQSAMEQYYAEEGVYPTGALIDDAFQSTRPNDPKNESPYTYSWDNVTTDGYCICALFETSSGNADAPPGAPETACNFSSSGSYYCAQNQQ